MFKRGDSSNNQKLWRHAELERLFLSSKIYCKCELVFDLTEKHISSQRFLRMIDKKNVIFSAKLY